MTHKTEFASAFHERTEVVVLSCFVPILRYITRSCRISSVSNVTHQILRA